MTPVLSVRNLKVHFPLSAGLLGGPPLLVKAVDDVSFDLAPGEVLAVVGESGCGKSTLGRAVLKLIPPTAGTIAWNGSDVTGLPENALRPRRRDMQIIFQDPLASLDPRMTVAQIIGRPLRTFHPELKRAEIATRVNEAMRQVGLSPALAHRYPHEFSGGQCQRIGIARAIILRPKLIVCDEPVSALDVSIQAQIVNLLMRLRREMGMALIFISHNMSVVRHISDRVMVLYLGREAEIAGRDTFFARPLHPYAQALLSAVPVPDPVRARQRRRVVLQGDTPSPINPPSGCAFRTRCPHAVDLCARAAPPLRDFGPDHRAACHRVEELAGVPA
ncbi:oligopeptide transport system ATP-binding protein [Inquilinus ginsengisoli]|uniref:ABC transporter ATP-binding protein n=1 Tax=Inquilinus ginsengisoli TaxID=363840 RepID=UPI003D1AEBC2